MREIKFRAWNGVEMSEPFDLNKGDPDTFPLGLPLMQYTGLEDKNGREIYEGDIIKGNDTDQGNCIVKYIEAQFDLYSINGEDLYSDYFLKTGDIQERELEIIGNIYETPELLN